MVEQINDITVIRLICKNYNLPMTVIPMKIIMYYFCSFCKRNFQKKFLSFFGLAGAENFFQLAFVSAAVKTAPKMTTAQARYIQIRKMGRVARAP